MTQKRFETRIFVQGMGGYVPRAQGGGLLVLFPDGEQARSRGIEAFNGEEICKHYAVAQFNLRNLDDSHPDAWASVDISGCWAGFSSDTEVPLQLEQEDGAGLLPEMSLLLAESGIDQAFAHVDPRTLPGPDFDPRFLKAGLYLDRGAASPANNWVGPFEFSDGGSLDSGKISLKGDYSNVVEFELGWITRLELQLKPFPAPRPEASGFSPSARKTS